jgi:O-antigen ligase
MCFRTDKLRSSIILLAAIGTFTATTYIVLMIVLVLIFFNPFYLLLIVPLLFYLFNNVFLGINKFEDRFMGFSDYLSKGKISAVKSATSLSFLSNFEVATYTISKSPLLGSGLGGNELMYERFFANDTFRYHYLYGLNAPSAHNLLIRVFSEMGILGGIAYIFGLIKGLVLKGPLVYRVISIACFSHFLCKALKLGGYFDYGTPFFLIMMWFNFVELKNLRRQGVVA